MNGILAVLLAVLSIWDYPSRQPTHERLRMQFVAAVRKGDTKTMEVTSRKGVSLLPDDPTWRFNLACALAYFEKRENEAFDELEKAIDLGFRNADAIAADTDLKRLSKLPRHAELVEYAREMSMRPLMFGPLASVDATGVFGKQVSLGEQNLGWDFDIGGFVARMRMSSASAGGNTGDLYMNRDAGHSVLNAADFPGLTVLKLDQTGRDRGMDLDIPNLETPYPLFGNCSRAFTMGPYWRSMPRALMTIEMPKLKRMVKYYLSNQTWVFPANADIAPIGTNGDVFASIAPYWIATAGRSYSDLPYLRASLEASRAFETETKAEIVRRKLLAPTIQTLIRKSLKGVSCEDDYLSAKAHPTAFPANAVELSRLVASARAMKPTEIPPLAVISVDMQRPVNPAILPELTYATTFAWAYVLRADDEERTFGISAKGAAEFAFVQTHGAGVPVKIEKTTPNTARLTLSKGALSPTNRIDIAVFGRNPGTGWGAPSYVCFSRVDPAAPYSDPALTPQLKPPAK